MLGVLSLIEGLAGGCAERLVRIFGIDGRIFHPVPDGGVGVAGVKSGARKTPSMSGALSSASSSSSEAEPSGHSASSELSPSSSYSGAC